MKLTFVQTMAQLQPRQGFFCLEYSRIHIAFSTRPINFVLQVTDWNVCWITIYSSFQPSYQFFQIMKVVPETGNSYNLHDTQGKFLHLMYSDSVNPRPHIVACARATSSGTLAKTLASEKTGHFLCQ